MPQNEERVVFTREMKKDYTILVPTMLPIHFKLMLNILRAYGYKCELLENTGKPVVDAGLRSRHHHTRQRHLLPGAAGDRADDRRARIGEI